MKMIKSQKIMLVTTVLLTALFGLKSYAGNEGSSTSENLKAAFIGESTASAKYAAYAKQAAKEGHQKIALLFKAASKAESIHAGNHKAVMKNMGVEVPKVDPKYDVKTTAENLNDAIKGESYEVATMYPNFLKAASKEGANLAMISFNYAYQVEKIHKALYQKALAALENNKENTLADYYMVCTTCGNTYENEAPARCGISMTPKERFVRITKL